MQFLFDPRQRRDPHGLAVGWEERQPGTAGQYRRAVVMLMMVTAAEAESSCGVKSRPLERGIAMSRKYPGVTARMSASGTAPVYRRTRSSAAEAA